MKSFKDIVTEKPRIPSKKTATRRSLAIADIEKIIGKHTLWRWFSFPIYIPTEWIESWKEPLILHYGNKRDKLFDLLNQSRQ